MLHKVVVPYGPMQGFRTKIFKPLCFHLQLITTLMWNLVGWSLWWKRLNLVPTLLALTLDTFLFDVIILLVETSL